MIKTDILEGQWKPLRNKMKVEWKALTDDDLNRAEGNTEVLADILSEKYGFTREKALEEIHHFVQRNTAKASRP